MSTCNEPIERQPALKITTNVISFATALLLGLFCTAMCRWLGVRDWVLYFVQLISMAMIFVVCKAIIYGIVDAFAPPKGGLSSPGSSELECREASPSIRTVSSGDHIHGAAACAVFAEESDSPRQHRSEAAVLGDKEHQRIGRFLFICMTIIPPMIIMLFAAVISQILFKDQYATKYGESLGMALMLILWLPCWMYAGVFRYHDLDRSGWWVITLLIPLFQWAATIYLCCWPGTPGRNRFGLNDDHLASTSMESDPDQCSPAG
jgi:uncharacterized membrane protein YhaH (DUF805 family)